LELDQRNVAGEGWRPANVNPVLPINFCAGLDEIVTQLKEAREQICCGGVDLPFQTPGSEHPDELREGDAGRAKGRVFDTFDLERNLADDTFSISKASAEGSEFRTAPLMGLGRIGAPFLHDARVYLSKDAVKSTPAGTVTTNRELTNAPLVVRSLDDAILAAIELHDLPAPDDKKTPTLPGAGCPVPGRRCPSRCFRPGRQHRHCDPALGAEADFCHFPVSNQEEWDERDHRITSVFGCAISTAPSPFTGCSGSPSPAGQRAMTWPSLPASDVRRNMPRFQGDNPAAQPPPR
jgi:hypothetical protein